MTISDLMPAHLVEDTPDTPDAADAPGASSALRRPGHDMYPAGTTTLESGTDLYLYFELYGSGASAARPATLRIQAALVPDTDRGDGRLERLLGGIFADADRAPVSVDFSESVSTDVVHRYLILRTDGLDPGHYTVAIRVTDPETDHTTQSTRTIELTEQVED
ncbi:MAG: hypothetical protein HKN17_03505 [Rhodothermales bacterium]|nr:hypothetical protein [Rhodothermales bacterium]